jgi:hypothetical protein
LLCNGRTQTHWLPKKKITLGVFLGVFLCDVRRRQSGAFRFAVGAFRFAVGAYRFAVAACWHKYRLMQAAGASTAYCKLLAQVPPTESSSHEYRLLL